MKKKELKAYQKPEITVLMLEEQTILTGSDLKGNDIEAMTEEEGNW